MKFGVVLPRTAVGSAVETVTEFAQRVEAAGYDHLLAYDHVLGANPEQSPDRYHRSNTIHEPLTLFAHLAGVTSALTLVTGILILPQRQTALVAKQTTEVDILSDGRLRLGVGIGWNDIEYHALGMELETRGARIEEQIEVLRALWTQELVEYEGDFHSIPDAGLNPLPVQRPIPIWIGGDAEPVLERTGRMASGWLPREEPPAAVAPKLERVKEYAANANRDPSALTVLGRMELDPDGSDTWINKARAWADIGCTHLAVNTMNAGYETVDEHLTAIESFGDTVADAGLDDG